MQPAEHTHAQAHTRRPLSPLTPPVYLQPVWAPSRRPFLSLCSVPEFKINVFPLPAVTFLLANVYPANMSTTSRPLQCRDHQQQLKHGVTLVSPSESHRIYLIMIRLILFHSIFKGEFGYFSTPSPVAQTVSRCSQWSRLIPVFVFSKHRKAGENSARSDIDSLCLGTGSSNIHCCQYLQSY